MEDTIGKIAIKIACIQTSPGEELNVKEQLREACEKKALEKPIFFKGFGAFDIILIYLTKNFSPLLSESGPIPGILKSNLFLCYHYFSHDLNQILNLLRNSTFAGFSLLKMSPGLQNETPIMERLVRQFLGQQKNWSLLGSLGWNEMMLLMSRDHIGPLCKDLIGVSKIYYINSLQKHIAVFIKTLSFLGLNYEHMPPNSVIKRSFKRTKSFLEEVPRLGKSIIDATKTEDLLTVEVSAKPLKTLRLKKYFRAKGFAAYDLLGKRDLLFVPNQKMSFSHFLASVLNFRAKFKKELFSTNIRLRVDFEEKETLEYEEIPTKHDYFDFRYPLLENAFGETVAKSLANHFYSFNSLSQDPICGDVFSDMKRYPAYVLRLGELFSIQPGSPGLHFAQGAREVLRYGSEIRSYGTYENIEQVAGRFSALRGGAQRAILAIEFLPAHILGSLHKKYKWSGFVVTGHYKFFHVNEVINVPTDVIWKPQDWWALYHEIAHILIENRPDWTSQEVPSVLQFLANKEYHDSWLRLIIELTAEVVGFELGFYGDFDLFFTLLWNHLTEIDPMQRAVVPIEPYAIRSFFTKLFQGHFRKIEGVERIRKKDFLDRNYLFQELIKHMEKIEETVGAKIFNDKHFLAAENAEVFRELFPYAEHLSEKIKELPLRSSRKDLSYNNTEKVVATLLEGQIWWGEMARPKAILYHLLKSKRLDFSQNIATILTFWNQQVQRTKGKAK